MSGPKTEVLLSSRAATTADPADAWGREIARDESGPFPLIMYTRRRHLTPEMLIDARRFADREHMVQGDLRLTFADHEDAVARVGAHLLELGIRPGDAVMLLAANSVGWVVSYWAVQRIGAVVVLGNQWWSGAEAAGSIATIDPTLVIADEDRRGLVPDGVDVLGLGDLDDLLIPGAPVPELEPLRAGENDPAVVIFTSGTTGAPKGAILPHRAVITNVQNLLNVTRRLPAELPPDAAQTVTLHTLPLFHVGGIQTLGVNLMVGAKMVFLPGRFDPGEALRLIERERVTHWAGVPTMLSRMIDHPDFADIDTSTLRSIVMGGSSIPQALREKAAAVFPSAKGGGAAVYGLTECGGTVCSASAAQMTDHPGTVGRPVAVAEIRIDPEPGFEDVGGGEIVVRTPTMMLGYWGKPQGETSQSENPIEDDGWLHTGDMGRIDEDGLVYLIGRKKDIIIRGGENIASAHVESRLREHPDVIDAAVVGLPHPDLGEEVGAAVVIREGAEPDLAALRAFAAETLARFSVPTRWWIRTEPLPTNGVGKVLKSVVAEEFPVGNGADR